MGYPKASLSDFLEVGTPRPSLILATTRDFFSIQGARESYSEIRKAYQAFGIVENIGIVEDDSTDGYTPKNREALYAFFQKALDLPGSPADEPVEILKPEELNVTPTGQISAYLPQGESVFSINRKEAKILIDKIESLRKEMVTHLERVREKAKELSGYQAPVQGDKPVFRGRYRREGYAVEMYALQGEGHCVVPLLLFVPDGNGKFPVTIYLNPAGKAKDASLGGEIEKLVKKGFMVAAPDVAGTGETEDNSQSAAYAAVLIGRSMVGIQAGDIVRVVNFLKERGDVQGGKNCAVALDEMCPALLHAAAFETR